jgi:basic membrane lipoprotein Med (substrate-binding protein (PBP1-ABC) superfamily)
MIAQVNNTTFGSLDQAAWSGIQQAGKTRAINAQRFPLPPTPSNSIDLATINEAIQQHCGLILTIGPEMSNAIRQAARSNHNQDFIAIGGDQQEPYTTNLEQISRSSPLAVSNQVNQAVERYMASAVQ